MKSARPPQTRRRPLRRLGWLLFWLLAVVAALMVLLFLRIAIPALITSAQGGSNHFWFFDATGYLLAAAVAYLVLAVTVIAKRCSEKAREVRD